MEMSRFQTFPIEALRLGSECQSRAQSHPETIQEYAETYRTIPDSLPAIKVVLVAGSPQVVDGYHRVTAALTAGLGFLRAEVVYEGTEADARWLASSANITHGLRRTNADKARAIRMAMDARPSESDRAIAEWVGVHNETVSAARRKIHVTETDTCAPNTAKSLEPDSQNQRRTGRDGKSYPVKPESPRRDPPQRGGESAARAVPSVPTPPVPEEELPAPPKAATIDEYADHTRLLRSRVKRAAVGLHVTTALECLQRAENALRASAPVECPTCAGKRLGCQSCGQRGWVSRSDATAITRGVR